MREKSPLRGRYLLYNRAALLTLSCIDFFLDRTLKPLIQRNRPLEKPRRLLLVNIAHLGDALLTTSLLKPLKTMAPELEIGILSSSDSKAIFQDHPLVSHHHCFDHFKNNRSSFSIFKKLTLHRRTRKKALSEIKAMRYDTAIDLNLHYPSTAKLLWQAKIPQRLGFTTTGFSAYYTHEKAFSYRSSNSIVDYWLELLSPFFSLERESLKPLLREHPETFSPFSPKSYLVIHMGSGAPEKEWPLCRWKMVAQALSNMGLTLLFTGRGESEKANIDFVIEGLALAENLANKLSWQEYVTLIKNARALISVDTVAGHIASLFDTPAILIYNAALPTALFSPLSSKNHILSHPLDCSPCFRACDNRECMNDISVEEVLKAFKPILSPISSRNA